MALIQHVTFAFPFVLATPSLTSRGNLFIYLSLLEFAPLLPLHQTLQAKSRSSHRQRQCLEL